jgi:hypothetical protein
LPAESRSLVGARICARFGLDFGETDGPADSEIEGAESRTLKNEEGEENGRIEGAESRTLRNLAPLAAEIRTLVSVEGAESRTLGCGNPHPQQPLYITKKNPNTKEIQKETTTTALSARDEMGSEGESESDADSKAVVVVSALRAGNAALPFGVAPATDEENSDLDAKALVVKKLIDGGISPTVAADMVERVQLSYLTEKCEGGEYVKPPWRGPLLVAAIRDNYTPPDAYFERKKRRSGTQVNAPRLPVVTAAPTSEDAFSPDGADPETLKILAKIKRLHDERAFCVEAVSPPPAGAS